MKSYRSYAVGETIAWAETELTHLGSIVSGIASLTRTLEDGRNQIVGLLMPSDFIGRPGRSVVPYDAVAVTDVTVCPFERTQFEALLERSPTTGPRMLEMTLDELDAAREWMLLLGRRTAREKVVSFLLMLARRTHIDSNSSRDILHFDLPLTRAEIGDFLGLNLETTSRQFSGLEKEELVSFSDARTITIPDLGVLASLVDDDNDGGLPT